MSQSLTHKAYLYIAIPFVLSTITQPLLGAVGIGIVGQLENPVYIAGVSVGTVIFDTMYWLFGFLRVSTTAFSAQASEKSGEEQALAFYRPLAIALLVGFTFVLLQGAFFTGSMWVLAPEADVQQQILRYYRILVWGAPLVLSNYVMLGWMMGRALIRASLFMQISGNVLNILLDVLFVNGFHMDVTGVAAATLISQLYTTLLGVVFVRRYGKLQPVSYQKLFQPSELSGILRVNSDLMLRTACLLVQTNLFTAASASLGTSVLSANAILLQIQLVVSYTFDGIANASSVWAGRACGLRDEALMRTVWKRTAQWTAVMAIVASLALFVFHTPLIRLFTPLPQLLQIAGEHAPWLAVFPLLAGAGLTFYGVFTGSSATRPVRDSMFFAMLLFVAVRYAAVPIWANHGLWAALLAFYLGRSLFLLPYLNQTLESIRKESITS